MVGHFWEFFVKAWFANVGLNQIVGFLGFEGMVWS
jgi:hypothetical protein